MQKIVLFFFVLVSKFAFAQDGAFNDFPLIRKEINGLKEITKYKIIGDKIELRSKTNYNRFGKIVEIILYQDSNSIYRRIHYYYASDTVIQYNKEIYYQKSDIADFKRIFEEFDYLDPQKKLGSLLTEDSVEFYTNYTFQKDSIQMLTTYSDWYQNVKSVHKDLNYNKANIIFRDTASNLYVEESFSQEYKLVQYYQGSLLQQSAKIYNKSSNADLNLFTVYHYNDDKQLLSAMITKFSGELYKTIKVNYSKKEDSSVIEQIHTIYNTKENFVDVYKTYFINNLEVKKEVFRNYDEARYEIHFFDIKGQLKEYYSFDKKNILIEHILYKSNYW